MTEAVLTHALQKGFQPVTMDRTLLWLFPFKIISLLSQSAESQRTLTEVAICTLGYVVQVTVLYETYIVVVSPFSFEVVREHHAGTAFKTELQCS